MDPNTPQNNQVPQTNPVVPVQQPPPPSTQQNPPPVQPNLIIPGRGWYRFWASVIDNVYVGIVVLLIAFLLSFVVDKSSLDLISSLFFLIFYFFYAIYCTTTRGRTFGKDAYGLRIVKFQTSENPSYGQAIIRELLKYGVWIIPVVGDIFYLVNGFSIVFSSDKRGWHDKAANTQVVKVTDAWNLKKQLLFILLPLIILVILVGMLVFALAGKF